MLTLTDYAIHLVVSESEWMVTFCRWNEWIFVTKSAYSLFSIFSIHPTTQSLTPPTHSTRTRKNKLLTTFGLSEAQHVIIWNGNSREAEANSQCRHSFGNGFARVEAIESFTPSKTPRRISIQLKWAGANKDAHSNAFCIRVSWDVERQAEWHGMAGNEANPKIKQNVSHMKRRAQTSVS